MVEDLIKRLRDTVEEEAGHGVRNEAADLIKRQAEDIAENDAIIDELRDHLTALESERDALLAAAGKEAVPEGWKLVPVEPTTEMVSAARIAMSDYEADEYELKAAAALRSGIFVAPAAALEKGGGRDAERYRHLRQCNSGSLVIVQIIGTGEDDQIVLTEEDADEAIDAALSQKAGEQQ